MSEPLAPDPRKTSAALRKAAVALTACLLVYFASKAYSLAWKNETPSGDQTDYLLLGQLVAEGMGMAENSNRGPILPCLLAPLASPTPGYFAAAKLLVFGFSMAALTFLVLLLWRLESPWTSLGFGTLLANNVLFLWYSGRVYPENLLVLFCTLSFLAGPGRATGAWGWRAALLSGFSLALAYLAKPTALLLAPAMVLGWVAEPVPWKLRWRSSLLFVVAFLAVASPWLVRNCQLFGNPFYTNHATHEIWMEGWDQVYSPGVQAAPPTAGSYFRSHTLGQIAHRELSGMHRMVANFVLAFEVTLQPIVPGEDLPKIAAALIAALAALGLLRERRRAAKVTLAAAFFLFFVFFSWDTAIVDSPRFLVPVVPLFLLSVSRLLGRACSNKRVAIAVLVVIVVWTSTRLVFRVDWPMLARNPAELGALPPSHAEIVEWIATRTTETEVLCYGPEESLYPWITRRSAINLLTDTTPEGLSAYLTEKHVRYLILDLPSLNRRPYLRPYFDPRQDGTLEPRDEDLAGDFPRWTLVFTTTAKPNQFLVYQVNDSQPSRGGSDESAVR